jgi:hypothetical protein
VTCWNNADKTRAHTHTTHAQGTRTHLRVCWPVAEFLQALAHLFIFENVEVLESDVMLAQQRYNRPACTHVAIGCVRE